MGVPGFRVYMKAKRYRDAFPPPQQEVLIVKMEKPKRVKEVEETEQG